MILPGGEVNSETEGGLVNAVVPCIGCGKTTLACVRNGRICGTSSRGVSLYAPPPKGWPKKRPKNPDRHHHVFLCTQCLLDKTADVAAITFGTAAWVGPWTGTHAIHTTPETEALRQVQDAGIGKKG